MYVIGIVGPFGSGGSYIAKLISKNHNYEIISLSHILRAIDVDESIVPHNPNERKYLQDKGNAIRDMHGSSHLAELATEQINKNSSENYVVDSIRNPAEILFLRNRFPNFYLFGVFADADVRWDRVKNEYSDDRRDFDKNDERDSGKGENASGQQVTASFRMSDVVILNNENIRENNQRYREMNTLIKDKIDTLERKIPFRPTEVEAFMASAYAMSMLSSCLKRKVGSVIVDKGNVFSSGCNEVPSTQKSCHNEYGKCYRDQLKADFKQDIEKLVENPEERKRVVNRFGNFKIMDYCKALHAEENAILNVARVGASSALSTATLYTTTYPCNMCANKIAQVGIKEIVYFEPYPMKEAKKILTEKRIVQTPFQGVTYNGYFRLMEVID